MAACQKCYISLCIHLANSYHMANMTILSRQRQLTVLTTVQHETILVVDENVISLQRVPEALRQANYDVHVTYRTADIWRFSAKLEPDLVVLITQRPDTDWLILCRHIKRDETLGFTPLLVITPDREAGMISEADAYLVPPFENRELLATVHTLLRVKSQFDKLLSTNLELNGDLTKKNHHLERALHEAQTLEVIKNAIIQNVDHELRTPVLQVKSAISLLNETVLKELDAGVDQPSTEASILEMATKAIGRIHNAVENITQLSKSENISIEPMILRESIDMGIRQVNRSWTAQKLVPARIEKRFDDDLPFVLGDKRGVSQVVALLLDNALKFSPGGTPVDILVRVRNDRHIWVGIRDYGIGIAPEEITRIFELFYQIDSSTSRRFDGMGIGLALAKIILDKMNGTMQVESELGAGSTFWFALPIATL